MALYSGLTADTAKHLQLDAGCFVKNYDVTKRFADNKANIIGATAGGGSFSATPTIRQIEVDGKRGAVKGFQTIDDWSVSLTASVKELTAATLKMALATATASTYQTPAASTEGGATAGSVYSGTKITGNSELSSSDYMDNVAWVGRLSGTQQPIIIIIKNALCTNGLSLSFKDKAEATMSVTLTGHYDLANLETPPFEIYYPTVS